MGPEMLSVCGVVLTAAMGIGSFLTPKLLNVIKRRILIVTASLTVGLSYLVFAAASLPEWIVLRVAVLLTGVLLLGIAIGVINVLFNTLFMEQVSETHMARVSGIANAVLTSMVPVGSLLCALVSAFCPIALTFVVAAVFMALIFLPIIRMKGFKEF